MTRLRAGLTQASVVESGHFRGLDGFLQDIRHSLRTLQRNPGVTIVTVAMLALGLGINAAVFTVINAAIFRGFPLVHRNDRIVQITTTRNVIYYPDFEEWRAQAASFEGMALVRGVFHNFIDGGGTPSTSFSTEVSADTFRLLGVKPILGRDFAHSDEQPGAEPVVILRYEMWVSRFAANPAVLGKTVRIDGLSASVIGVMPKGFSFPASQDFWLPLVPTPAALRRETGYARWAFARLADGVTPETARAEMETIGHRLATAHPRTNQGVVPVVKSFEQWFIGADEKRLCEFLWAAGCFVLLIVCGNVANLLVQQTMARSREISVRLALGAGRWRIIRQFVMESLLLAIAGGVLGWWIAEAGLRLYPSVQLGNDVVLSFAMDTRVVAYLIAVATVTGLVSSLAAIAHVTKLEIGGALSRGARGIAGGRRGKHSPGLFAGAQIALTVILLASAGVMIRSFLNVYAAGIGVDTAKVLTMGLNLPPQRYPAPEARRSFYRDLETHLRALPGVQSVAFASAAPTDSAPHVAYELADRPTVREQAQRTVSEVVIGTGYFQTLGAKLIAGRDFDDFDRPSSLPVVVVNREFANRNWPGESASGKRVRLLPGASGIEPPPWLTVVGVVSNIIQNDRTRQAFDPLIYVPEGQHAGAGFAFVRTNVAPGSLSGAVRRQIYAMDPNLPVPVLWPLAERLNRAYGFERNVTGLLLFFAAIALFLASVGLYATISHSVNRRIQEIGVRVAVGATGSDILKLIFRQGMVLAGTGLGLGLTASFAANRILKSQLVGVSPADPVALAAASAVLVLAAALGCWLPARRAMRVDPVIALKYE